MSRCVGFDELTDVEIEQFNEAVQAFRGVSEREMFHSVPVRDDAGAFSEVWFYRSSDDPKPYAAAVIGDSGQISVTRKY
jgi:hypothetical protein